MTTLLEQLAAQAAAEAGFHPCAQGHTPVFEGGANAGCDDECVCSVPVYGCSVCGDLDYGDNEDAREIIDGCEHAQMVKALSQGFCPAEQWIGLSPHARPDAPPETWA